MKNSIQGDISIRISEDEMIAYLDFKPSQVLVEWSDDLVLDILKEAGVTKGYKKYHFSRLYNKIRDLEDPESFEIAWGVEPISSELSRYNVLLKQLPKSLEKVYEKLSFEHSKPQVHKIVDDYFLNDDVEEKPLVVLNHFYIDSSERVMEIDVEKKAADGYTVTGNIIPPPPNSGVTFSLSNHFKIDKNTGYVTTKESGFVRVGKDWMDLIPYVGSSLSLSHSDDFAEYFLSFKPGNSDSPIPEYSDILDLFSDIDYPLELLKSEDEIQDLLKRATESSNPVKFSLTKPKKSVMKIDINQSKTKAVLILEKGAGKGERLSLKVIGSLIRESKIKGMNLDGVKQKILSFYKSRELYLEYTILEGKTATRGEPRRLKFQKEFISIDKIEAIVNRIDDEIETLYPSFKTFTKEDISSGILVKKDMEFAILTDPIQGDDGVDIYGVKINGLQGNDPIIKTFENISIKQNKYISNIDGILDIGEKNGETLLRVREHKDMFVDIRVAMDAMSAFFTFYPHEGSGERASIEFINRQIEASGVVKGISSSVVEESYNKFIDGELISEVEFAKGEIPTDKKSSRIKFYNNSGKNKFSYEAEKGSVVATIFPSKEKSEDGYDVLGTIMESSGIVNLDLDIGDYILEDKKEDGTIDLVTDINGEIKVDNNSITIIDKKVFGTDVSVKTGSIKTLCSLVVKGSVMSSLYVVSGGNIKILGTVQGALISSDKNIIISQGVKGEGKAVLRSKEKIDVKFIEKANVLSIDDVHIRKAALQTRIICNGKVLLDKGGTKIIGGETKSKKGLVVDELGSNSGTKTKVSFGQDYLIEDKITVFEKDVEKIHEDLLKIDQILHKPGGHLPQDKLAHLRKQKVFLMKKLEKKNMRLFLLREKFEEHSQSEVIVRDRLYEGVIFESHGRTLEIMEDSGPCKIVFNSSTGQIEKR